MERIVLSDAGYWIGLLDPRDPFHMRSLEIATAIETSTIAVPWPCMYEIIATRLTRRRIQLLEFEEHLSKPNIVLLSDNVYKANALEQTLLLNRRQGFTYSLVDSVIREILKDKSINVNLFVTFNTRDFADLCTLRQISILN